VLTSLKLAGSFIIFFPAVSSILATEFLLSFQTVTILLFHSCLFAKYLGSCTNYFGIFSWKCHRLGRAHALLSALLLVGIFLSHLPMGCLGLYWHLLFLMKHEGKGW